MAFEEDNYIIDFQHNPIRTIQKSRDIAPWGASYLLTSVFSVYFCDDKNEKVMKTFLHSLILTAITCLALASCNSPTKRLEQAQTLNNEGMQLREQRRSEEAAEKFLQGLALV